MKMYQLLLCGILFATPAFAAPYTIDYKVSSITFSGKHAGTDFNGSFGTWQANVDFDANNLAKSSINATFDTTSAKTGNLMYDGTLPSDDWFNSKTYPQATFKSTQLTKNTDGSFTAKGDLTLRDSTFPVSFIFTVDPADFSIPQLQAKASLTIDRLQYGIGMKSDAKAEWVDKDINIILHIVATRGE